MDGDEIGLRDDRIKVGHRDSAGGFDGRAVDIGIINQNAHLQRQAALHHARANAAKPDHKDRLFRQVDRELQKAVRPSSLAHHRVMRHAALGQREHHEHRLLGDGNRIGRAGDHQRHAPRGQRRHVHCVISDTDPGDRLEVGSRSNIVGVERGDGQCDCVSIRQQGMEFRPRHVGRIGNGLNIVAGGQQIPSCPRHRVRRQNSLAILRHHWSRLRCLGGQCLIGPIQAISCNIYLRLAPAVRCCGGKQTIEGRTCGKIVSRRSGRKAAR